MTRSFRGLHAYWITVITFWSVVYWKSTRVVRELVHYWYPNQFDILRRRWCRKMKRFHFLETVWKVCQSQRPNDEHRCQLLRYCWIRTFQLAHYPVLPLWETEKINAILWKMKSSPIFIAIKLVLNHTVGSRLFKFWINYFMKEEKYICTIVQYMLRIRKPMSLCFTWLATGWKFQPMVVRWIFLC